ncbi:hypothetical protein PLICRDRAFT_172199 [Plicaturopsis crispa FD-325 SS-3]|nr:hypothetical protein PLICRDRAFT_172199 [Plicaturopsis crispa FD-325 SS-3]
MKSAWPTFCIATACLASTVAAASFDASAQQQSVLSGAFETKEGLSVAQIEHLASLHDDPVELMKLLEPANAAELDEPRLLQVFGKDAEWMTEGDKLRLRKSGLAFMDLTGDDIESRVALKTVSEPVWPALKHQSKVQDVISHLDIHNLRDTLTTLTSFFNRFYKSEHGAQSSHWIYLHVLDIIAKAPSSTSISLEKFTHPWAQSSIIARFEPPTRNASSPHIIIGAHQDSANYRLPLLPAPGADDDGSGTVTILEAFRALAERGFTPEVPVEFHWYSAEEGGLLGSKEIVREYVELGKNVGAMIQFDMVAYTKQNSTPTVTFITTDVHQSLTNWTMHLAKEYADIPVQGAKLFPGAGSDHMSFHRAKYPSIFATEADPYTSFDPYIHTANDVIDLPNGEFSFEHALEFAKVAIGFAVELGGWAA